MGRTSKERRRQEALYRLMLIAPLLPPQLSGRERARRLEEIIRCPPPPPYGGDPPALAARTLRSWLEIYRAAEGDPLAALEPKVRGDRGASRTVPPELLAQVISLRERAPGLSVKEILKRIDHPARAQVSRRNVSRALREAGYDRRDKRRRLAERRSGPPAAVSWDLARWEADFPNEVWQVDSTPSIWLAAGRHRERAVQLQLVNIIDDHSRLLPGGGFTERLGVSDLLRFLGPAILTHGCPAILFVDRAKIHRSTILTQGIARLGGTVIFGTAGHAPGHGKVERLHQTQEATLIEDLRLERVETAEQATARHEIWRERYGEEVHGETDESPRSRWQRIAGNARIPTEEELRWAFRGEVSRQVSEVGAIRWSGRVYEAPASHRRSRPFDVSIRFDLLDSSQIWIEDEDGTRHACPLYRTRSHTERRRKRAAPGGPSVAFRSLFDEAPDGASPSPKSLT